MRKINLLNTQRIAAAELIKIKAVDPAIESTDAAGSVDGEYRESWNAYTA